MTFTQIITPDDGMGVAGHTHDGSEVSGEATFLTVRANRLLAGTIDGKEIVISGGVNGILRSDNYAAGSAGWQVLGDGSAEFNDVTVRGAIIAGAGSSIGFDDVTAGSNVASLTIGSGGTLESSNFSTGVAGWQIDGDGNAEFQDVTVRGVLTAETGSDLPATFITAGTITAEEIILSNSASSILRSANFSAGTAGWRVLGDGTAEFNDIVVRGDIVSSNWDGADPVDLSAGADTSATLGFALDSSAGAAQFTGPVYFLPPDESTAGAGDVFSFGDGFSVRVYQDNPTVGEDTLWFLAATDATDHMVFGPASASSELKTLTLKALSIPIDFGSWAHTFPKGIVYDWGYTGETSGDAVATTLTTVLSATASVPANVSVSVLAWGFVTFDNEGPISDRRFAQMDVGGTGGILAIAEVDSVTGSDGAAHTHSHSHAPGSDTFWFKSSTSLHQASNVVTDTDATAASATAHTHAMDSVWQTLSPLFVRSFTPTGTTVTVNLRVQTEGTSETFANKALMYMVVVN